MPSYKTHSIHGDIVLFDLSSKVKIYRDDYRTFCMGHDTLIGFDYETFKKSHYTDVKGFFEYLIKEIKSRRLHNDSEVMAFLYGQLDHYVLDLTVHPLIYYMTANEEKNKKISPHGLVELWIDNYTMQKYGVKELNYYHNACISNKDLKKLIDDVYLSIYGKVGESKKYELGMKEISLFDSLIRTNMIGIVPIIEKMINLGKITYGDDVSDVIPYLNLERKIWHDPETGRRYKDSFEDLWSKSIDDTLETIDDVNAYLYRDKQLYNRFITHDISYNTAHPCSEEQKLIYVKK